MIQRFTTDENRSDLIRVNGNLVPAKLLEIHWGVPIHYENDIYSADVRVYEGGIRRFYDVALKPIDTLNKELMKQNGVEPLILIDDELATLTHRQE